jgi:hypothetical protein
MANPLHVQIRFKLPGQAARTVVGKQPGTALNRHALDAGLFHGQIHGVFYVIRCADADGHSVKPIIIFSQKKIKKIH